MIQNNTARRLMYEWHNGQTSAFYAAASSGLVACFDTLVWECKGMSDPDKAKLEQWIEHKKKKSKHVYIVQGQSYNVLPWVSRSYHN